MDFLQKFNITQDELNLILGLGFKYDEKSGWFMMEHDDPYSKDYLIIKESEFLIETEDFLTEDDGSHYTEYTKFKQTFPEQSLTHFLNAFYL